GAANILALDRDRCTEAIALAVTPNVALSATRYGHLSMWKGCAAANAARNAVFAALLAEAGITGPEKPIEGGHGLQNIVGKVELGACGGGRHPFGMSEISLKQFASVASAQPVITVGLPLSARVELEEIEKVTLYTYRFAWEMTGKGHEKWRPQTREAADH